MKCMKNTTILLLFLVKPHQMFCKYVIYYPDTSPFALLSSNINVSTTNYEVTLNHSVGICVDIMAKHAHYSKVT